MTDKVRTTGTRIGCAGGSAVSLLAVVALLSFWSRTGAPQGRLPLFTFFIPFAIPPLFGAAIGTAIGARLGRLRAEHARAAGTFERDANAREAFGHRLVAAVKAATSEH